jgi:hypothetical protein
MSAALAFRGCLTQSVSLRLIAQIYRRSHLGNGMTAGLPLRNRAIALLTLGRLALAVRPAFAQHLSFHVGPMAGAAIASWRGADTRGGAGARTSFVGGGFVTIGIGKYFALEPQVLYVQKGTELTGSGVTVTYKQDYVEIPLLITGKYPLGPMGFAPTIFAGPAVAFQTSCRFSSTGTSGPGYQVFPVSDAMCDSLLAAGHAGSMRHTDALLVLGGGFNVGPLALLARYDLGLTRFFVQTPSLRPPLDIETKAWLVSAGFRLPLGKRHAPRSFMTKCWGLGGTRGYSHFRKCRISCSRSFFGTC